MATNRNGKSLSSRPKVAEIVTVVPKRLATAAEHAAAAREHSAQHHAAEADRRAKAEARAKRQEG
jgi:hypothetical protein